MGTVRHWWGKLEHLVQRIGCLWLQRSPENLRPYPGLGFEWGFPGLPFSSRIYLAKEQELQAMATPEYRRDPANATNAEIPHLY